MQDLEGSLKSLKGVAQTRMPKRILQGSLWLKHKVNGLIGFTPNGVRGVARVPFH